MQIASILSDLTSLRVCDHSAALALVSTRAPASESAATDSSKQKESLIIQEGDKDVDMQRAIDLMELHHGVKMKHVRGEDQGLMQARKDVEAVLARLEKSAGGQDIGR
ncbi:MAG: hypothetical protein LQ338_004193 [Usnochroma carphineum]|nr:MAG: hypothetical protein LQ338_004193 [Usnochroma carphineum]